jgi:hypothetical protein
VGLDSEDERQKLAAAKIVFTELREGPKQPKLERTELEPTAGVSLAGILGVLAKAGGALDK